MEQKQLEDVMLFHLQNFNGPSTETLTPETRPEHVFSKSANSRIDIPRAFQDIIGWTFEQNEVNQKEWPQDWQTKTVKELADYFIPLPPDIANNIHTGVIAPLIIALFMLLSPFVGKSQLEVTVGAGRSELKEAAITIGMTYVKSFDSIWQNKKYRWYGKTSTFSISPELDLRTGSEDAFSSITLKVTGLLMHFKTTRVSGVLTPNTGAMFHTFPMSVGVETNNMFNNVNAIAEVGWVPWYQARSINLPAALKTTSFGVYLQAGYKARFDTIGAKLVGGELPEAEELGKKIIARVKGSFDINTKTVVKINNLEVGLVGSADVWFDVANGATYYKIDGRGRFYLDALRYIDLIYQKGSGAPNFNQGVQYGVGLTNRF